MKILNKDFLIYSIIKKHSILIIVILHAVGVLGILSPYKDLFVPLTPINLLFSFVLFMISFQKLNNKFIFFCTFCYIFSYLIELTGVQTGGIFGTYHYGSSLGVKLWGTPLLIGINWLMLSLSVVRLVNTKEIHPLLKIILASLFMVLLDFLIEPIAIDLNFWNWENNIIPLKNYIAWFFVSMAIFSIYFGCKIQIEEKKDVVYYFYSIQLAFFGLLNILI